jgi:PilZ domain
MATGIVSKSSVERHERRATNRYDLVLPVTVQTTGQPSRSARSKDVSRRGIYLVLESDDNLLPGTELDLTVTLPHEVTAGTEVFLCAHGRAVRLDKSAGEGTGDMGLAVAFETCDFIRSAPPYYCL